MVLGESKQELATDEVFVFPASFAQQRLWFVEQLAPESTLYNTPLVFRITGMLHHSALEQSLQAIAHRHETLRTTFEFEQGELVQVVTPTINLPLLVVDLRNGLAIARETTALDQIRAATQQSFNLQTGPLVRVCLWQLDETEHLLLMLFHHIIFDEWSSGVFIQELGTFYRAFLEQKSAHLAELPIQYADFALWQRDWLQGEVLHQQLSYWRQQLKDLPILELPGKTHHKNASSHRGASQFIELPQRLLDALENLSQQADVTLFMTLLAAFQTLLHRYTQQTDLVIGSPIANRHRSELEGLIGFLVNSLVLRTDLAGDPGFRELLNRVRDTTLAAYEHQDLPFEKLVEELHPTRNFGKNPLFQVVFALQNAPMEQLELPGLTLSPVEFEISTTRFDLEFYLWKCTDNFRSLWGKGWQQSDGLRGVMIYNRDVFDEAAIAALLHHFQTLLEGIVACPDAPLSALPLLTATEQQEILNQWNQTRTEYPVECIHELFEQQTNQRPEAIALKFADQQFTYNQLNEGSNQLAHYLQKLGIQPGMRVGICVESSCEAIAAMLAILKAGGAYVPLDSTQPPERLRFIMEDAQVTVVLTQRKWLHRFKRGDQGGYQPQIICLEWEWEAIAQESEANLPTVQEAGSLAYVMYTSGSTGTPKGVMVPHRAVVRLVKNTNYIQIASHQRMAQIANLAFDASTFEVWGALLNGAQLVGIERETTLSPVDFVAALRQEQIDILFLTTALLNQTVVQIPDGLRSLTHVLFGGEAANPDRVRAILQEGKPQHLLHVYGPTENTTFSTYYEVSEIPDNATTIPIGQAIANTQVYVLDKNLNLVPPGVMGEIYLTGAGLANGYLNRPDLTQSSFIPVPANLHPDLPDACLYQTGDRARYHPDGNLEFLGRRDHQVKIRGFRIELGEIEAVLMQHPTVQAAMVVVREVEGDRQLIAYVVAASSAKSAHRIAETDLRDYLKSKLPPYMVPVALMELDEFPLTPNGKIDRKALPRPTLTPADTIPAALPTTALEASLMELWGQLLGRTVGPEDNFFELGGHSLLATQLVSRMRDRFQIEIPLRSLFETPTIAGLVKTLSVMQSPIKTEPIGNDNGNLRRPRE